MKISTPSHGREHPVQHGRELGEGGPGQVVCICMCPKCTHLNAKCFLGQVERRQPASAGQAYVDGKFTRGRRRLAMAQWGGKSCSQVTVRMCVGFECRELTLITSLLLPQFIFASDRTLDVDCPESIKEFLEAVVYLLEDSVERRKI